MFRLVEGVATSNHYSRTACSGDIRSSRPQKTLQVYNLRFSGRIGDHGRPLRTAGRQHNVLCGADTSDGQHNFPALKPAGTTAI